MELYKGQIEKLSIQKLGFGFSGIDLEIKRLENLRLDTGREIKTYGDLDKEPPIKYEFVVTTDLFENKKSIESQNKSLRDDYDKNKQSEIEKINKFNGFQRDKKAAIESARGTVEIMVAQKINLETTIETNIQEIADINQKILDLKKRLAEEERRLALNKDLLSAKIQDINEKEIAISEMPQPEPEKPLIPNIPEPTYLSTDEIETVIQNALAINQKAELYENWLKKKEEKAQKEFQYEKFDDDINDLRQTKLQILREIDTGVKGLEIREDGIYFNNEFCENWSDAQSLNIACQISYPNLPPLRAIFIDGAESLGRAARETLDKFAREKDIQIGICMVAEDVSPEDMGKENVFWIEDGLVTPAALLKE